MQGNLTIFALQHSYELKLKTLGKEKEDAYWPTIAGKMKKKAAPTFFGLTKEKRGVMVSGKRQENLRSVAKFWDDPILALGQKRRGLQGNGYRHVPRPDACYPGCPYAYHYVTEALLF